MTAWGWIPALLSLVGAGLAYVGARAGTGQREQQGRREEWGRRFSAALDAVGSAEERRRIVGRVLLELDQTAIVEDNDGSEQTGEPE